MWDFYQKVVEIPGITLYGDFENQERCPIVSLNVAGYDSSEVSDFLAGEYGICLLYTSRCV